MSIAAPTLTLGSNFELRPKQTSSEYQKLTHGLIPASISPLDGSSMASNESSKDQPPRVLECTPNEGPAGITVRVVIQSLPSNPTLKLAFGGLVVDTKQLDNANFTTLAAIVPNTTHTQNNSSQVPISVCIYDNDTVHNSWVIGEFTYTEGNVYISTFPMTRRVDTDCQEKKKRSKINIGFHIVCVWAEEI